MDSMIRAATIVTESANELRLKEFFKECAKKYYEFISPNVTVYDGRVCNVMFNVIQLGEEEAKDRTIKTCWIKDSNSVMYPDEVQMLESFRANCILYFGFGTLDSSFYLVCKSYKHVLHKMCLDGFDLMEFIPEYHRNHDILLLN